MHRIKSSDRVIMVNSKCVEKRENFALDVANFLSKDVIVLTKETNLTNLSNSVVIINDIDLANNLVDIITNKSDCKFIIVAPNKTYVCYELIRLTSLRYSLDI